MSESSLQSVRVALCPSAAQATSTSPSHTFELGTQTFAQSAGHESTFSVGPSHNPLPHTPAMAHLSPAHTIPDSAQSTSVKDRLSFWGHWT
jgi:hypothetical protein